jgi:hypothetical protein
MVSVVALAIAACSGGDETTTAAGAGPTSQGGTGGSSVGLGGPGGEAGAAGGTAGSGGAAGQGGQGGTSPPCVDDDLAEPNEVEQDADLVQSDPVGDCDGDGYLLSGTIAGADDVDWFVYQGDDGFCVVNPSGELAADQPGARLCIFIECLQGDTEVGPCEAGESEDTSPDGLPGCCSTSSVELSGFNCTGTTNEDLWVYMRVDQPGGPADVCNEYDVTYHY